MLLYLGFDVPLFPALIYLLAGFGVPAVAPAIAAVACGVVYHRPERAFLSGLLGIVVGVGATVGWWAVIIANGTPGSFIGSGSSIFAGSAVIAVASACFTWWLCRRRNPSGGY